MNLSLVPSSGLPPAGLLVQKMSTSAIRAPQGNVCANPRCRRPLGNTVYRLRGDKREKRPVLLCCSKKCYGAITGVDMAIPSRLGTVNPPLTAVPVTMHRKHNGRCGNPACDQHLGVLVFIPIGSGEFFHSRKCMMSARNA